MKKLIIFGIIALTVLVNSCKKPKGDEECTREVQTTDMNLYLKPRIDTIGLELDYGVIEEYSEVKYNKFAISLNFGVKKVSDNVCSTPTDSVIGRIDNINVIVNYLSNNDTITDTINSLVKYNIPYINNSSEFDDLSNIKVNNPLCSGGINLYFNTVTDTNFLQFFTIEYYEIDGTFFTGTTKPIYLRP